MKKNVGYILLGVLVALTALGIFYNSQKTPVEKMSFPDLVSAVEAGQVAEIYMGETPQMKVTLKDGSIRQAPNPRHEAFKSQMLLAGVEVKENAADNLSGLLGFFMAAALMFLLLRGKGHGAFARYAQIDQEQTIPQVTFNEVAGGHEAISSMRDLVDFLKAPEQFKAYGARAPRGVILFGPPGTGKTLMAKALAGEAGVPFYSVNGSDFVQVYVGVGASRVRALFQKARKAGRAVIFIDEIDAIGKKRDSGNDEREQTLNALLTEMSGFQDGAGVIVMAATNRLDALDEALLRAGRFDRQIEVPLPDVTERLAILKVHSRQVPLADEGLLTNLAAQTPGFSGARLECLMNEAAILAARRQGGKVDSEDLEKALVHMLAGQENKNRQMLLKEKEITCLHEAGHALVSLKMLPQTKINRVTVIPSTRGAAGYVMSVPEDRCFQTQRELQAHLMVMLAGRAAEEEAFGAEGVTTGAAGDLKKAWQLALQMVSQWGMSPTGHVAEPAARQQEAAACLLESAYEKTRELLKQHREAWQRLSGELMEKETLTGCEVKEIINIVEMLLN